MHSPEMTSPTKKESMAPAWMNQTPDLLAPAPSTKDSGVGLMSPKRKPLVDLIQNDFPRTPSPILFHQFTTPEKRTDWAHEEAYDDDPGSQMAASVLNAALLEDMKEVPPRAYSTPPIRAGLGHDALQAGSPELIYGMRHMGIDVGFIILNIVF